jgi:uncharacterized membrane protein YfcA
MNATGILGGLLAGGVGGIASGFLGITSGGILVPLLVLILGKDQHVAQGVSLLAQVVPTSLSGVRNYSLSGHRVPLRWLVWLAIGFAVGGCVGALLATHVSDRALQWTFVGYLVILEAIVILRPPRRTVEGAAEESQDMPLHWASLGAIGHYRRLVIGVSRHWRRTCDHRADGRALEDLAESLPGGQPRRDGAARHPPPRLCFTYSKARSCRGSRSSASS